MTDYIRRSDVLELSREYYSQGLKEKAVPVTAIRNIPSADVVDLDDLDKGCFYGVGTDGVFYKLYPRINLPLAKKINVETGEIIYPTNADRIRAMSDEEMSEWMVAEQINGIYAFLEGLEDDDLLHDFIEVINLHGAEEIKKEKLEWLKQEAGGLQHDASGQMGEDK